MFGTVYSNGQGFTVHVNAFNFFSMNTDDFWKILWFLKGNKDKSTQRIYFHKDIYMCI